MNSSHPPLQHMQAFDEDWDTSLASNLHTEFNMRPDLTPTKDDNRQGLSFQRPDLSGSPSFQRREEADSRSSGEGSNSVRRISNDKKGMQGKKPFSFGRHVLAVVRTSILSFILLMFIMSILLVVIIETDSEMFTHLRRLPEMIIFKRDYYDPLRENVYRTVTKR